MKNSEKPAFASVSISPDGNSWIQDGLTKREYFAGLAMQGLCSNPEICNHVNGLPDPSKIIGLADELLSQLEL